MPLGLVLLFASLEISAMFSLIYSYIFISSLHIHFLILPLLLLIYTHNIQYIYVYVIINVKYSFSLPPFIFRTSLLILTRFFSSLFIAAFVLFTFLHYVSYLDALSRRCLRNDRPYFFFVIVS